VLKLSKKAKSGLYMRISVFILFKPVVVVSMYPNVSHAARFQRRFTKNLALE
jgi:hypothetical protein